MGIWITLTLGWLALNVVLVLLLWRRSGQIEALEQQREAQRAATRSPLHDGPLPPSRRYVNLAAAHPMIATHGPHAAAERQREERRVIHLVGGDGADAHPQNAQPEQQPCPRGAACQTHELQAEIRNLRLTVAELSLERARLSSAMARRKS